MQARVIVVAIETYYDKDDHLFFLYALKNKPLHLTLTFDSRTEYPEFACKKDFDINIAPRDGKVKNGDTKCVGVKHFLKETSSETENRHRYKFIDKIHGISILFDGLKEYEEFVLGKWFHFTIDKTKRVNQTTLDHVNDQEAAGAKS